MQSIRSQQYAENLYLCPELHLSKRNITSTLKKKLLNQQTEVSQLNLSLKYLANNTFSNILNTRNATFPRCPKYFVNIQSASEQLEQTNTELVLFCRVDVHYPQYSNVKQDRARAPLTALLHAVLDGCLFRAPSLKQKLLFLHETSLEK